MNGKLVLFLLAFSSTANSLINQPPDVKSASVLQGLVIDGDTQEPIAGAHIQIGVEPEAAVTGPDGRFSFVFEAPTSTVVSAKKSEYVAGSDDLVSVNVEARGTEIRLLLYRSASICGRVVDEDSRAPLPGILVRAQRFEFREGRRFPGGGGNSLRVDKTGRFCIAALRSGDYFLEIQNEKEEPDNVLLEFTEKDVQQISTGHADIFWPGDPAYSAPLNLIPGSNTDVGDVLIPTVPLYRVHLTLSTASPDAASTIWFQLLQSDIAQDQYVGRMRASAEVGSGNSVLLIGLESGRYSWKRGRERTPGRLAILSRLPSPLATTMCPLTWCFMPGATSRVKSRYRTEFLKKPGKMCESVSAQSTE